ncbi:triose-phosphate isomerase [Sulfitobacter marinus]
MNKTLPEAEVFASKLAQADIDADPTIQRFVIPPFTTLREVKHLLSATSVKVGAQNMHWADKGAWTGEISAPMLVDCGADMVELGHSERRAFFGETDEFVGRKTAAAVKNGLIPLICIGETLDQRNAGEGPEVLEHQVRAALGLIPESKYDATVLFAYEPVWAIGENGTPASSGYADDRHAEIIDVATRVLGRRVPCLYGGSVNPGNCAELIECPNIDGLFIGRSAWNVDGYLDILKRCAAAQTN